MNTQTRILGLLAMLAEQSKEDVSETRLRYIAGRLMEYEAEKVTKALCHMLDFARKFPTVDDVLRQMGESQAKPEEKAMLLVERCVSAVPKFGEVYSSVTMKAVENYLGTAGFEAIERTGGWNQFVSRCGDNLTAAKAHLRDFIKAAAVSGGLDIGEIPSHNKPASVMIAEAKKEAKQLESGKNDEIDLYLPKPIDHG